MQDTPNNWHRIENNIRKIGIGDGRASGQDSTFQKCFNDGYLQGFDDGYTIGKYKATLFGHSQQNNKPIIDKEILEQPHRGWCQICSKDGQGTSFAQMEQQQAGVSLIKKTELMTTCSGEIKKYTDLNKSNF